MARDFSRASWRLKLARAEKHLEELDAKLRAYGDTHPYEARRKLQSKADRKIWRFVLWMPPAPDADIAIIVGDIVHNLRSALDHLAVALAPRKRKRQAGFPVENQPIWKKAADGNYLLTDKANAERRRTFESRLRGIHPTAKAIIEDLQPYWGNPAKSGALSLVSSFENTDKHRGLVFMNLGLTNLEVTAVVREGDEAWAAGPPRVKSFCESGTVLYEDSPPGGISLDAEVEMQIVGTPMIAVETGLEEGGRVTGVEWTLRMFIIYCRAGVFPALEALIPCRSCRPSKLAGPRHAAPGSSRSRAGETAIVPVAPQCPEPSTDDP